MEYRHGFGPNVLTSENTCCSRIQNPLAQMSNLASLVYSIVVRCFIHSPVSGDNVGSTCTSWHTSYKSFAVKSLTSLWRMLINPPFLQNILCWIVNANPQVHLVGKFAIDSHIVTLHCQKLLFCEIKSVFHHWKRYSPIWYSLFSVYFNQSFLIFCKWFLLIL